MTVGGDTLHERDGALADERDRHGVGAHALARDAAGGVGVERDQANDVTINGKETQMTADARYIALGPGEGEAVLIPDGRQFLFKTVGTDTGGAYALGEFVVPPAGAALPHIHWGNEEAFYVLDGEFTVGVGEQSLIARTGSFILVPRGTVHGLRNAGTKPAKLLFVISPAGMERMFVEIGQLLSARDRPPDRAAIQAIREKYRTQDVGEMAF